MEGKVALISGIAIGQGRTHAVKLAQEGADIIGFDVCQHIDGTPYEGAKPEDLDETVRQVEETGRRIIARQADVRDFDAVKKVVDEGVAEFGHLDTVSANAGIFTFGEPAHEVSEKSWRDVLDINLTGVWHTTKAATPHLIDNGGGTMTLTSSTAGIKGTPAVAAYTSAKHALVGLMRTLALELAPESIRVNTIHPTGVEDEMIMNEAAWKLFLPDEEKPTKEQASEAFQATNALPVPWIQPVDVSNVLLFLASDEARYVTGTEMKVDAGYTIK